MSNFVILFTFHKITPVVLRRLKRLRDMNRDDVIIPMFGVQQRLFFPGITINTREMRVLNLAALRSRTIYRALEYLNQRVESFRRQSEISSLRRLLERWGLNLYCDYTPMGWHNLDIVIIKWFSSQGKNIDFEHLIFLEHDVYLTKPVSDIYSKYTDYDAGFTHYGPASLKWKWYHSPHKAREFLINWLRERGG
ncbi:MAG: hypothetical protein NZ940_02770 [Candidatus Nezhaarchaeota archaeon]|nr:hypothetical protein [Candidatus Nezhaarchaeota archaeon]